MIPKFRVLINQANKGRVVANLISTSKRGIEIIETTVERKIESEAI